MLRFTISFPTVLQRLVSPRRQQRIVENLNDRFVRPRLDSYPSTVSFLELLNVARSRVGISQKTSHGGIEFHATRDSTLFLLQAQMFCIYNRESSNRMEFKPRIYIYIYIISRKILEEKRCFICANLIFTEVGGIRERRGKENIKMPRRRSTISRRLVFVACARAATLLAFYAWDTDTRIIINCLRRGQSEFSLSSLSIFL